MSGIKEPLFGKTLAELTEISQTLGLPSYTGKQLAYWLYKTDVNSYDGMSNVSKKSRTQLAEKFDFGVQPPEKVQESTDGTKKYLFRSGNGKFIEAAYIPDGKRHTLCVSSQVGCKMGCLFCMTGKQGFQGHLTTGEILNQLKSIPKREKMTNVVYMGMGEPFDNLDAVMKSQEILTAEYGFAISVRKVTVSTIGIVPAMRAFLENSKCNLAVSLHTPFDEERRQLMPIQNVYPLKEVIETIREFDIGKYRRVSFEYIMFKGVNDTRRHVNELARVLNKVKSRINLIRFHPIPGTPLLGSDEAAIIDFQRALNDKGIVTTLRASRGQDIDAACGLLSTKELVKAQQID
ncbi:MAG: 23S rRNA (adenine(2503)-C(2))-methyltransferase RlmN [Bacteroidetes bacterium HGW-Bacteroidetes-9]|jgi:23S rRNA (adenine2503-C2)-methyltransferase|nr:MAG: 23S rRNA (adenine(2503)-C(2))-methyltransferase RlmN [Bacteroidetes bacterium HGW-Bacteroidetes-9]